MFTSNAISGLILTGAAFSAVLYLLTVGMVITLGILDIINLSHGVFAAIGGYVTFYAATRFGLPFVAALSCSIIIAVLVGLLIEVYLLRRVYYKGELAQVLMTIGLDFVAIAAFHFFFGSQPTQIIVPSSLDGVVRVGEWQLPKYRAFLILVAITLHLFLWGLIEKTQLGAHIRATVDNRAMAGSVGLNTSHLLSAVFGLGVAAAALGGALGSPVIALQPEYPLVYLPYFLIIVSVSGTGSLNTALVAAVALGFGDTICKVLWPQFGAFFVYAAALLILALWLPYGLSGRRVDFDRD